MVLRLVLSLAFVAGILVLASRVAKKRGLGGATDVIEVVSRARMGRTSNVAVLRVAGRVLVVGSTEAQITLLAELEDDELQAALPVRAARDTDGEPGADGEPTTAAIPAARRAPATQGALAGSVLDRSTWTSVVSELRERTVRR